ncbi:hypothetical protein AB0J21_29320 [Streptomyces sp. NPDC049954]|uniref:hypothetical protein n=1 Tax=Streptomyces sp. NPDC049954 TaxID=3155779 RepID=UPI0034338F8A
MTGPPDPPEQEPQPSRRRARAERKQVLLRLDPLVHDALARWAADELRSANAQIEFLLRRALAEAGRLPGSAAPIARRGRPHRERPAPEGEAGRTQDEGDTL